METRHDELVRIAAERLAREIDEAIRAELAAAFAEDRPTRLVELPTPLGGKVRVELAPDDQARLYL